MRARVDRARGPAHGSGDAARHDDHGAAARGHAGSAACARSIGDRRAGEAVRAAVLEGLSGLKANTTSAIKSRRRMPLPGAHQPNDADRSSVHTSAGAANIDEDQYGRRDIIERREPLLAAVPKTWMSHRRVLHCDGWFGSPEANAQPPPPGRPTELQRFRGHAMTAAAHRTAEHCRRGWQPARCRRKAELSHDTLPPAASAADIRKSIIFLTGKRSAIVN